MHIARHASTLKERAKRMRRLSLPPDASRRISPSIPTLKTLQRAPPNERIVLIYSDLPLNKIENNLHFFNVSFTSFEINGLMMK